MTEHEHPNLTTALVAALAELTVVEKGHTANAGSYSYDYADLADVVKLVRPALARHGLTYMTPVHEHPTGLACTVVFLHESGESMKCDPLPFSHGRDAQATGSAITYHRRFALVAALGMAAGDDDDGASAAARPTRSEPVDGPISEANADALVERCLQRELDPQEVVKRGTNGRTDQPAEVLRSEIKGVKEALEELAAESAA